MDLAAGGLVVGVVLKRADSADMKRDAAVVVVTFGVARSGAVVLGVLDVSRCCVGVPSGVETDLDGSCG